MRRTALAAVAALTVALAPACGQSTTNPLDGLAPTQQASDARTYVALFDSFPDLDDIPDGSWEERGRAVVDLLVAHAADAQAAALDLADAAGVAVVSAWIDNSMIVRGDAELGRALTELPGVAAVYEEPELDAPDAGMTPEDVDGTAVPWNLEAVGAPARWASGDAGAGIVVAGLGTGVDAQHPALREAYLGAADPAARAWFDATGTCPDDAPCDDAGHGTHTLGIAVGRPAGGGPAIGVAPEASWMAAKGCRPEGCRLGELVLAAQFLLAPTAADGSDPDPSRRPHVVNASWDLPTEDRALDRAVAAMRAAGTIVVLAAGNAGPDCATLGAPGDTAAALTVGALARDGGMDPHSSRGPGVDGITKPDLVAPGEAVVSTVPGGGYATASGTSMAAPHVAGSLAILLADGDPDPVSTILDAAQPLPVDACESSGVPNNTTGAGALRLEAP